MSNRALAIKGGEPHTPAWIVSLAAWAEEHNAEALLTLISESTDVLMFLVPPHVIPVVLGTKAASIAGLHALAASKSRRLFNILLAITSQWDKKLDCLRAYTADEFEAIRECIADASEQTYEEKARILLALLEGRLSTEKALRKDKNARFRRWILSLDLTLLRILGEIDPRRTETYTDTYNPDMRGADRKSRQDRPDEFNLYRAIYRSDDDGLLHVQDLQGVGLVQCQTDPILNENVAGHHKVFLHEDFFELCSYIRGGLGAKPLDG